MPFVRVRRPSRNPRRFKRALRSVSIGVALLGSATGLQRSQAPVLRVEASGAVGPFARHKTSDAHRVVYRYSVVPGGVQNREELQEAIRTDPVVADHYRRFDSARAYAVTLQNARAVHVS